MFKKRKAILKAFPAGKWNYHCLTRLPGPHTSFLTLQEYQAAIAVQRLCEYMSLYSMDSPRQTLKPPLFDLHIGVLNAETMTTSLSLTPRLGRGRDDEAATGEATTDASAPLATDEAPRFTCPRINRARSMFERFK